MPEFGKTAEKGNRDRGVAELRLVPGTSLL